MAANKPRTAAGTAVSVLGLLFSGLYLINPTGGLVEIIPDALPLVGNIDEVFVSGVLFASLHYLGLRIPGLSSRLGGGPRDSIETKETDPKGKGENP
jgi:hypothetical protein